MITKFKIFEADKIRWYHKGKFEPAEPIEKDIFDDCEHDWIEKSGFRRDKFTRRITLKQWSQCTKCGLRNYGGKLWKPK